ncbi:MAG: sugar phosphate nucleotidyltransferase, partial [bacterium]
LNITRFIHFHQRKRALVSLSLAPVEAPSSFGIAIVDKNNRITRFLEKPSWGEIFSDTVNMGIYVMEPRAFDFVPEAKRYYFARDLFPNLLQNKQSLFGFIDNCYWQDIGDLKTYQQVHREAFEHKIDLPMQQRLRDGIWQGSDCKIGKGFQVEGGVLLGDHCIIEKDVYLSNSVIGNHCRIGQNTSIRNTILWDKVVVERGCELVHDVVGNNSIIGEDSYIDENVFIADHTKIGSHSQINANVKIWPNKDVDEGSVVNFSLVWGDKWQRELFTDARVTGLANMELSPEFGAKLGAALGTWIGKGNYLLLSRDATPAARMISRALVCGLLSAGVHVHSLQVMPIPVVRCTLRSSNEKGGVHVRRSPFERKLLDILFFDGEGRDFSTNTTKAVERIFYREDFPRVAFDEVGTIDYPVRVAESYVQDFLAHLNISTIESAKYKVVIDYSYGAATQVFPTILGSLDCEVIALDAYLDVKRLTRTARKFEQALKQLAKIVQSTRANAGFLIDAGAEKIICVDETGRIIPSERLAILISKLYFDTHRPPKIAVPVSVPSQIEQFAQAQNIDIVYTADDGGSIMQATEDAEVSYALDINGGFIFTNFHFAFDGMYALVKILELLAQTGGSLSQLNDDIPKRTFVADKVSCPWEAKGKVMRRLTEFSEHKQRLLVDGVKIIYDDAWVLVVPHRDKAFYHVMAEAVNDSKAKKLVEEFKKKVLAWRSV